MRQAEVNNAAAEVSTTFQATPRRRGPSPTLNLGFTARLAWAIAMLLHISIRYQYWCLCCRRAATYRHCSIASLIGAQDRATHFALHPNEPGKGRPAPVTSQQLPDRAGPRATPRRRKSPQRHSRATAALGALALASATSAAFAAATPPPAALISQISAGRLDITLAVHDGFKLDTCTTESTGSSTPALTDTTTATTNSANTGDTAMNNSNSRGTEEPSTTNPSNGAASLLIVSETAELLTDDLEPPTAYGKFQIEPPIVGQTINEPDYDYSDAWGNPYKDLYKDFGYERPPRYDALTHLDSLKYTYDAALNPHEFRAAFDKYQQLLDEALGRRPIVDPVPIIWEDEDIDDGNLDDSE
ncbi:hypothetical protein LAUMK42_05295 [Mycobacterium persicum]|uniref:Uncharacterized protein n=1 Tax=Mycobacterium persicum TaxID=1487726 RepID=A0AB38V0U3_9MYCO|nr:hypothetical protein LAUMK42_05295 [Mycobacterium persicum]